MGHKMRAYKEWPQGEAERAGLGASASSASGGLDWDSPQAGGSTVVTATQKTTGVTVAAAPAARDTEAAGAAGSEPEPEASTAAACAADRPLTVERLRALLAGARAGTLQRFFRSAPELPAHTADPGLVTVVGDSYDRLVTRQARDVLLIAHSPGPCSDCARMLAELPRLSAALRANAPSLLWATIDASKNDIDHPLFEANDQYPRLVLFGEHDSSTRLFPTELPLSDRWVLQPGTRRGRSTERRCCRGLGQGVRKGRCRSGLWGCCGSTPRNGSRPSANNIYDWTRSSVS